MSNISIFIDREKELNVLEEAYNSGRKELVIIYGRRRIGKTFLLSFFIKRRKGVYLVVNFEDRDAALRDLIKQLEEQVKLPYPPKVESFSDFYKLLTTIRTNLIVIDEFQRLHGTGGVTELQGFWDKLFSKKSILMILSGSSVGMMERIGLSHESPLYGRATRILKIEDFSYNSTRAFVKEYDEKDKIRTYAVFGGTPGYLSQIDETKTLKENIRDLVLKPGAPLREEPYFLLATEIREPSRYTQILEAIASGATKLGDIANKSGIKVNEVGKYIRILESELDLIERRYPLLEEGKRGKTRYYIKNNFFKFWYSLVFPYMRIIELGQYNQVLEQIWAKIDYYTSKIFEQVAFQHFILLANKGEVSFTRIGGWWFKDTEIDFIALDETRNTAYFIECKWTKNPIDKKVLYQLITKSEKFPWKKENRKNIYVIYSRAGFTFKKEKDILLFDLKNLEEDFNKNIPKTILLTFR